MNGTAAELLRCDRMGDWRGEPGEMVVVPLERPATLHDLKSIHGKAEIAGGRLILIGPSGGFAAAAAGNVAVSLRLHQKAGGRGRAMSSRVAYVVNLPNRRALCPDASWWTGGEWIDFPSGAPAFAAEVRDEMDYDAASEARIAAKRADYFAAGTRVVWDVDVLREGVIRVYRADDPEHPAVYGRGEVAEAEPAVSGWRFPVSELWD